MQYISKAVANMHRAPDPMSEVVSQAVYGTPITLIENSGDWARIQTPDSYKGWILERHYFHKDSPYPITKHVAHVNGLWTHLYWVDDTTPHPPAITLPFDTKIEIVSEPADFQNKWIRFRLLDGKIVWGLKGDVTINPKLVSLKEMIALSTKFLGIPYRWGGKSSFGFDCSGFVQTLYRQVGIAIPRDAKDQANVPFALSINKEDLQCGDLIFFGPSPKKITHVGMYLGKETFIGSTNNESPCGVQISQLHSPYWESRYITARRYT